MLSAAADGDSRSFLSVQSTPGWGCGMKTDGLHSPGTYIKISLLKCTCFTLVGDYPQIKVNAFPHTGKNTVPIGKDSTLWTSVLFFPV